MVKQELAITLADHEQECVFVESVRRTRFADKRRPGGKELLSVNGNVMFLRARPSPEPQKSEECANW